ncbi:MAG TPA: hypothetical protein ENN18_08840 [Proteobacteria bacterium]|nr:hypothetical protein [Pseudomonadota bacterium]
MYRQSVTTRLLEDGGVEVVDPDWESLPLLKAIQPDFKVRRSRLEKFLSPRLQRAKQFLLPIERKEIGDLTYEQLWAVHDTAIGAFRSWPGSGDTVGETSLLEIKIEIVRRALEKCRLCGRNCRANRLSGQKGVCGLGAEGLVGEMFTHIAEEPPVNPSINVGLRGCGLGCHFCQKHDLLNVIGFGVPLKHELWKCVQRQARRARSLSFIGGNPDESLYSILHFMNGVPSHFNLPVVWNSNGYGSLSVYRLLEGVVDAYMPDAKFYSPECSLSLADCANYFETFEKGLAEVTSQGVPVFVRMLVLPGHAECCHLPMIDFLSGYKERIKLNIMGQYYPDYLMRGNGSFPMGSRPEPSEVTSVRSYAQKYGEGWLGFP